MINGMFSIQWHITSNCLHRCKHCYMFDENYEPYNCTYDDFYSMFLSISEFCNKYGFKDNYFLSGGSPLLNPDCENIINLLSSESKQIGIMDIPEMVTDDNIKILKKHNIYDFQLSFDGLQSTHDSIRGLGSFENTIKACKKLCENGFSLRIMFTVSKQNFSELIPLCNFLIENLNNFLFGYDFSVCIGNASVLDGTFTQNEVNNLMDEYYHFVKNHKNTNNKRAVFSLKPTMYRVKYLDEINSNFNINGNYSHISGCYIGWSSICVTETGDVLPCRRLPIVIGNLKKESFETIFLQSPILKKYRRYSIYLDGCKSCNYSLICKGCPAITFGLTGNSFDKFPYCDNSRKNKSGFDQTLLPSMDSSNEEELSLIKKTFNNQMLLGLNGVARTNPKAFLAYSKIKQTNSINLFYNDPKMWQKEHGIELSYDDILVIQQMGNSMCVST